MKNETNEQDLYKEMYYRLFNLVSDVIAACDDKKAKTKLKIAQQITEEMYISGGNESIIHFDFK